MHVCIASMASGDLSGMIYALCSVVRFRALLYYSFDTKLMILLELWVLYMLYISVSHMLVSLFI